MVAPVTAARFSRSLAVVSAGLSAALGALVLGAWSVGGSSTLTPGHASPPPLSAFLFIVLGSGLAVWARRPRSAAAIQVALRSARVVLAGVTLMALRVILAFVPPSGPWLPAVAAPEGTLIGVVSGGTLIGLLAASVSLHILAAGSGRDDRNARAPAWLSTTGLLIAVTLSLGYFFGSPIKHGEESLPIPLLSAVAFLLVNLSLILLQAEAVLLRDAIPTPTLSEAAPSGRLRPIQPARLALVLALLGSVVLVSGYSYFRRQRAAAEASARTQLEAIASVKGAQIVHWRSDRLDEVKLLYSAGLRDDVAELLRDPSSKKVRERVDRTLEMILASDQYESLAVLNSRGAVVLATDGAGPLPQGRGGPTPADVQILFEGLRTSKGGPDSRADTIAVLARVPGSAPATTLGFVAFRLDPHRELFPLVRRWPIPSVSNESYLVERQGDEVLILSDVRFPQVGAAPLRAPLTDPRLSAAAAARGERGSREGIDYRRVPVLMATLPIPDSSWALVAEMDQTEAYALVAVEAWRTAVLMGFVLAGVALAGGVVWRHQQAEYLRLTLQAEHDRRTISERFGLVLSSVNDVVLLVDSNLRIVEMNDRAEILYGRSAEEMKAISVLEIIPEEDRAFTQERILRRLQASDAGVLEARHLGRDGVPFPVEVSARQFVIAGEKHVLAVIRDITERKNHEREIGRINRLYAAIAHVSQSVAHAPSRDLLLREACRCLVESGGFLMSWIGVPNPETGVLDPVASWGDATGYVERLRLAASPGPQDRGPSSMACLEKRVVISGDFLNDPNTQRHHEAARRAGVSSSASVPVLIEGEVAAIMGVYASEPGSFRAAEVALLEEAARDVAVGLERLQREEAQRRAEKALARSEERLRTALSAANQGVWDMRVADSAANQVEDYALLLGSDPGTVIDTTQGWIGRLHPEDQERVVREFWDYVRNGVGDYRNEYRVGCGDGTYRWVESIGRVMEHGPSGIPTRVLGTHTDITERKRSEEVLRSSLREKEALLKEVHHRVNNNLQVIMSLLRLVGSQRDDSSRVVLQDMLGRIRSMALLHDSLYRTGNFAEVDLADYLKYLGNHAHAAYIKDRSRVVLVQDLSPVMVSIDHAIPFGLILNELLTNSFKHAFPENTRGKVEVTLGWDSEMEIRLEVADDGIGLPPDLDARGQKTLGLQLVDDLVRQLQGRIETKPGKGAVFKLRFPGDLPTRPMPPPPPS